MDTAQLNGWWRSAILSLVVAGTGTFCWQAATPTPFERFAQEFTTAYAAMDPDPFVLEMRERLENIPDERTLREQEVFFNEQAGRLRHFDPKAMPFQLREQARLIAHIIHRNKERLALELEWYAQGRPIPIRGMQGLPQQRRWYEWLVERYTSTRMTPPQVKALGQREIGRCQEELAKIAARMGVPANEIHGRSEEFLIRDKDVLLQEFARIDSTVRSRLPLFVDHTDVPEVHAMEWPGAHANTPPAAYLPAEHNAYGADVFQFNFHRNEFDRRSLAWLYLHEAIPGHHLQFSIRRRLPAKDLRAHLRESGNFEGWACYVEYHGDLLGVYDDPWQRVGKWEWDLVRSVRLVLDVGIHYEGWSRDRALLFWKEHIHGQDHIAEREVDRVTAMPGQVLSYKVGAETIERIAAAIGQQQGTLDRASFHRAYLEAGELPLLLMEEHLLHVLGT